MAFQCSQQWMNQILFDTSKQKDGFHFNNIDNNVYAFWARIATGQSGYASEMKSYLECQWILVRIQCTWSNSTNIYFHFNGLKEKMPKEKIEEYFRYKIIECGWLAINNSDEIFLLQWLSMALIKSSLVKWKMLRERNGDPKYDGFLNLIQSWESVFRNKLMLSFHLDELF